MWKKIFSNILKFTIFTTFQEQSNEKSANEELQKLQNFLKGEKNIVSRSQTVTKEPTSSVSNMSNGKDKMLPSFWIPSKTPEAKETMVQKPDKTIYCPVSEKPLKIKDLISVKFTEVKDPDDKKSLIVKQARYMCPITHDILSNSVPCAVIKTTYNFFHFLIIISSFFTFIFY